MTNTSQSTPVKTVTDVAVHTLLSELAEQGIKIQLPEDELALVKNIRYLDVDGGEAEKGQITIEMPVDEDSWFFKCHFPGDPIMPGCLGIEGMWQSMGVLLAAKGYHGKLRALGIGDVKFLGEVRPHHKVVSFKLTIDKCKANRKMAMAVARGTVEVDGEEIYVADKLKVGVIFEEE